MKRPISKILQGCVCAALIHHAHCQARSFSQLSAASSNGTTLTTDSFYNTTGGLKDGGATAGLIELSYDLDLETLLGWEGTSFHALSFTGFGENISERNVGDQSGVSNIYSPYDFAFFHLFFERELSWGAGGVLKFGQFAADDDFMGADAAGVFINSSFGPYNTLSANTGTPVFPLGAPGVFLSFGLSEKALLKGAIFAGDLGGEDLQTRGFDWKSGGASGYATFIEFAYNYEENSTLALGGHFHTGEFEDYTDGNTRSGFGIIYGTVNHRFSDSPTPLSGFLRTSITTHKNRSAARGTVDGGLVFENLLKQGTVLGLGLSHTEFTDAYRAANTGRSSSETILELTAHIPVSEHLSLQPDIQYIINPHTSGDDALVLGLRAQLSF